MFAITDNVFDLKFTKFFDVESPKGYLESDKTKDREYPDVGVDTYMPKPTLSFINELLRLNPGTTMDKSSVGFSIYQISDKLLEYTNGIYIIYKPITIPSGIGLLIPQGYHVDYRGKSSNFNNGYSIVTGLIDSAYAFSCGVQIFVTNNFIEIATDQKIAQLVLQKTYYIGSFTEIPLSEWSELEGVKDRKLERSGGFGATGKFK